MNSSNNNNNQNETEVSQTHCWAAVPPDYVGRCSKCGTLLEDPDGKAFLKCRAFSLSNSVQSLLSPTASYFLNTNNLLPQVLNNNYQSAVEVDNNEPSNTVVSESSTHSFNRNVSSKKRVFEDFSSSITSDDNDNINRNKNYQKSINKELQLTFQKSNSKHN